LDEALATTCSGAVRDPSIVPITFCSMVASCERADDLERAEEWIRLFHEMVLDRMGGRPRVLHAHCSGAYGAVLCNAGRWEEAEAALLEGIAASADRAHRADTIARLAHLRLQQGRVEDAAALLAPQPDRPASWRPLAEVHLRRSEPDLAAAVARRGLQHIVGDASRRAPLLGVLVEAEVARGEVAAAHEAADVLVELAATAELASVTAEAALALGRVQLATGDAASAVATLEQGLTAVGVDDVRLATGLLHLALATALIEADDRSRATAEAQAALARFERLGAAGRADETAALLRSLGVVSRPLGGRSAGGGTALDGLTDREREVLELVRQGATNAEIGERLYISAKTVEHHVGRILTKLGARSRTEAAAIAAAATTA
jgi:DNA-binding CsgD family transcriptional regulator